ncbi:uncharacterized protein BDW70DRAFT_144148 [Aspergillus foveolatus]|uniref:uncharacterized protein n=1 Tax=Aspergillus foveolatus TaxID=210207 RepID=UPI003CCCDB81
MFSTNNSTDLSSNPPKSQVNPYAYEPPAPSLNSSTKADRSATESKREQSRRVHSAKPGDESDSFDSTESNSYPDSAYDSQDAGVGVGIGTGTETFHSKLDDNSDNRL